MLWRYGKQMRVLPARPLPVWTKLFRACTLPCLICERSGRDENHRCEWVALGVTKCSLGIGLEVALWRCCESAAAVGANLLVK